MLATEVIGNTAQSLLCDSDDLWTILRDGLQHEGFNPETTRTTLMKKYLAVKGTDYVLHIGSKQVNMTSEFNVAVDILCFVFNLRGNNYVKISGSSQNKLFASEVGKLLGKMDFLTSVSKTPVGADKSQTLCLSRVGAAFATRCVTIAILSKVYPNIDASAIDLDPKTSKSHHALCHQMCPALLTTTQKKKGYVYITFFCALKLNKMIGKGSKKDEKKPNSEWTYHLAALNSAAVDEEQKRAFWEVHGTPNVSSAVTKAQAWLNGNIKKEMMDLVTDYVEGFSTD